MAFTWSVLRDEVKVYEVSHGGSAMRTVPRLLNLPHVTQKLPHLRGTQSRTNHHLYTQVFSVTPDLRIITHLKVFVNFCHLKIQQWCLVTKSKNIATHRLPARTRGKHLPNAGGSTHDPRAVTQHEDQLFNVSRSKCPVLTRRQRYQFHPLHHLSYIHNK